MNDQGQDAASEATPPDADGASRELRVRCAVDAREQGLDVDWTNGAVFHFESRSAVDRWVERQDEQVTGTFYLAEDVPYRDAVDPDLYLKYRDG